MGSWSECCALSGLEIWEGSETYLLNLNISQFDNIDGFKMYQITMPPVKGKYNGYGSIVLSEDVDFLNLKKGVEYKAFNQWTSNTEYGTFVSANVFDFLSALPLEFSYYKGDLYNTLGEIIEVHMQELSEYIHNGSVKPIGPMRVHCDFHLISKSDRIIENIRNTTGNFDDFLKCYKRVKIIRMAEMTLRKRITPYVVGPQQHGLEALYQFNQYVNELIDNRLKQTESW